STLFFFHDLATTDIYTLSLHDALPISRMERLLKLANINKNVTPHSFRHTHTSLLIEANVHIKEIQERLGHSDISTTVDIYAHMTDRKSTRLNSSHVSISYAVFCLKKKK